MAQNRPVVRFSCERCFSRKVKCDKVYPCGRCARSSLKCVERVPPAPRKRRREDLLLERLNRADQLLREHSGSQPGSTPDTGSLAAEGSPGQSSGRLVKTEDSVRFVDNDLWNAVGSELPDAEQDLHDEHSQVDSDEDNEDDMSVDPSCDLIMGVSSGRHVSLATLHPSTENIRHLWRIYLDNVNPLTKIIHRPTIAKLIDRACDAPHSLDKADEVLLFSIYLAAVASLTAHECQRTLGEARRTLVTRYEKVCREALVRARFLRTSSLHVLGGFVMYLQALRTDIDSRTLWTMTGAANRIAHSLGLHQDGTDLGLPLFETEMRRRLWWQVLWLELRSAERTGSGQVTQFFMYEIRRPRNIDDDDFWPGQTEAELENVLKERGENRATEMINIAALGENATFWREQMLSNPDIFHPQRGPLSPFAPVPPPPLQQLKPWEMEISHRETLLGELQRRLEDKYIRYCDPSIPQQLLASIHIRAAGAYMRLMTYHPRRWGSSPSAIPPDQRALLWRLAMRILDLDVMQRTTPCLQRFLWRATDYFQWQALVYALQELACEPLGGEKADEGFARVHESFRCHPSLVADRNSLHKALCSLALKAWDARVAALQGQGRVEEEPPSYMEKLLQRRAAAASRDVSAGGGGNPQVQKAAATTTGQDHTMSFDPDTSQQVTEPAPVAASGPESDPFMGGETQQDIFMDWEMWDNLIQNFQAEGGEDAVGDMLDLSI